MSSFFEVVLNELFITEYNGEFLSKIITHGDFKQLYSANHRGEKYPVFWSDKLQMFNYSRKTKQRRITTYWNSFGKTKPQEGKNEPNPEVEINFATDGTHDKVAGLFLTRDHDVFVGHRGNISIGKNKFWAGYKGEKVFVDGYDVALIGKLDENVHLAVDNFVEEALRIRRLYETI